MGEITVLLQRAHGGDLQARNLLFEHVYAELSRLAHAKLAGAGSFTTLNAGSLVSEAYLSLVSRDDIPGQNRRMFFAYAASVMRSVIVDHVRRRKALKRGAHLQVTLNTQDAEAEEDEAPELELLDAALRSLALIDRRAHDIVELRYFGGLSLEEVADTLEISVTSVKRGWQKARAFLYNAMQGDAGTRS